MSPQPRRGVTRRVLRLNSSSRGQLEEYGVTPEELAVIRSSITGKEQAPSSRVQSVFQNWRDVADQLGDPFEVERIPISKLRHMRRDSMLGFGLSFIKTPHIRARWIANAKDRRGPNAQIAAHLDHDWRRIHAVFIRQYLNSLEFGFQAIAKRFEFRVPSGTYIDLRTGRERPIWSEGRIRPIAWKPFVALRPEGVEPQWNSDGEFDGILYRPTGRESGSGSFGSPAQISSGRGGVNNEREYKIDLPHSLWATYDKESNFGSIFGYPRLAYAYRYWWSYWFRWAIADRAFERKADPSVIVYHPDGEFTDAFGDIISNRDYALEIGERMRSGGVLALPSETYEDINGRGVIRQWEVSFTRDATNFEPFDRSFEYLDVQKLRSLFIPEQAFLEGKGGCLLGDTPIVCPRDHDKYPDGVPLKEMRPGDLVWSFNEQTSKFELRPVKNVWMTMRDAEVYKLTLDDGSEIIGTPDHPFMTRDGVWREMIELRPGDRLMPLYERKSRRYYDGRGASEDDYEPMVCLDPDRGSFESEYQVVAKKLGWIGHGKAPNVRHEDERHANTHPSNLAPLAPDERAHAHFADEHWKVVFRDRAKRRMEAMDAFKAAMTPEEKRDCRGCGRSFVPLAPNNRYCIECVEPRRQPYMGRIRRPLVYGPKQCEECNSVFSPRSASQKRCDDCLAEVFNHRVVSVEKIGTADVWDIEIDGPEHCKNYVANGVVVHNTSSRNVAAEMGESFIESQVVLSGEIRDAINRWIVPQWLALNYPEFMANGGTAEIDLQGFGDEDIAFMNQVVSLIGQQESGMREILKMADLRKILEDRGIPIASIAEQQRREREIAEQAQAEGPPLTEPTPTSVGVVSTPTGFAYVAPREVIYLSDRATEFTDNLPDSPHYQDPLIRRLSRELWSLYAELYRDEYESAAEFIASAEGDVELADFVKKAKSLIERWAGSRRWAKVIDRSASLMRDIMRRAAKIELGRVRKDGELPDEVIEKWIKYHLSEIAPRVAATTRTEVERFVAKQLENGVVAREELARAVREHFSDWPDWKADRTARTEVRDIYNAATLLAAEAHGVTRVQAVDAQTPNPTDGDCERRDGRIYTIRDALRQYEHPNGTLAWRMVPVELSIEHSSNEDGISEFDERTNTLVLSDKLEQDAKNRILRSVVEAMIA